MKVGVQEEANEGRREGEKVNMIWKGKRETSRQRKECGERGE